MQTPRSAPWLRLSLVLLLAQGAFAQTATLTSIAPDVGVDLGGTMVTLSGTGLDQVTGVTIGGAPLENLLVVDANTIIGNAPAGSEGLADVVLTDPGGSVTLPGGYAYVACVPNAGHALEFDGIDDLAMVGAVAPLTEHSIETWFKVTGSPGGGVIAGHMNDPGAWCGYGFFLQGGPGAMGYDVDPAGCNTFNYLSGPGSYVDRWVHVAGTWKAGVQRLYVDGVLVGEATGTGFQSSAWMTIGAIQFANGFQSHARGVIDELRIWDRELSIQEIRGGMHTTLSGSEPGLVGYWRFDEGAGQTTADSSPSGTDAFLGTGAGAESRDPAWVVSDAPLCGPVTETVVAYCSGDGSGTPCPCGNTGAAGHGCANGSFASGAVLASSGAPSAGGTAFSLAATASVPLQPGLFFQGEHPLGAGQGLVFGDGLRCAGTAIGRLEVVTADGSGGAVSSVDIASKGGVQAGETRYYQWWYRDPSSGPCGSGFNLSNGLRVTWQP